MKDLILNEIENQKKVYLSDPARIIADYNNEVETIKEYNGRQLLELLQNADDEQSEEVHIELNSKKNSLIISNRGKSCKSFTLGGIKSLMVSNFSPKTSKKYIGNKGLGFRSIVNWSNEIKINSNNVDVCFSRGIVEKFYDEICNEEKHFEIVKNRGLSHNIKPIAFLSVPDIFENKSGVWTTSITIDYKSDYYNDIKNQLETINGEILLFVNYVKKITVIIDDSISIFECLKENNQIYVDDKIWDIFSCTDELPKELWDKENEQENYELKIAIEKDFKSNKNLLYSYFPTKICVDLPFIIHGTFDLNSSRNDVNLNKKNEFVLGKLVELIIETAKKISVNEVSYKPLEFLMHEQENTTLNSLGFYEKIDNALQTMEIFPCVDNSYRSKSEIVFINNEFSNLIENTHNHNIFPNMLIPNHRELNLQKFELESSINYEQLNLLSKCIDDLEDRVQLIYLIHRFFITEYKFIVLIDGQNKLVSLDDEVYTPITNEYDIEIPDYVKIKFMNYELFQKLIKKFGLSSNDKHRDLQRILKKFTNIQSYEPAQVLQKIITTTNKVLEQNNKDKNSTIRKMVKSLFKNYITLGVKTKIPENTKIQLVSEEGTIENANNLFLSKSYPTGVLTEELFSSIYSDNMFLVNINFYQFKAGHNIHEIENFFLWLGVNKFVKTKDIKMDSEYDEFIESNDKNVPKNLAYFKFDMKEIVHFDKIIKMKRENFIFLCMYDKFIREEIYSFKSLWYIKINGRVDHHYTSYAPSYILFQIYNSNIFKDHLISHKKLNHITNINIIDYNYKLFTEYKYKETDINSTLLKLGAVEKFDDLSINTVRRILKQLYLTSPNGKQTQTIYKYALEHYKKNRNKLNDDKILICASKNDELGFFAQKDVYYSGNTKLPRKIINSKPILNFPRRQNTKDITNFFGINDLNSIKIEINEHKISLSHTFEFEKYFKKIQTYILAYRFEDFVTESSRRKDVNSLKNANIKLCKNVKYNMNNNCFELENNDYIRDEKNKVYYIKINNKPFSDLRKELDFRETFSDIIGSIFDIIDTEKYSRLISDELNETEEIIKRNIGYEAIVYAREFLGVSDDFFSFWKTIYTLKDKEFVSNKTLSQIKNDFNLKTDIHKVKYSELNSIKSCIILEDLFNELKIDLKSFNSCIYSFYKLTFKDLHSLKMKNCLNDNFYAFNQNLYSWCIKNSKQKEFLDLIGKYENYKETIDEYEINVNYQQKVENYIWNFFHIKLTFEKELWIEIDEKYKQNKQKVDFEKIEGLNQYRSLLYFDDQLSIIHKYIRNLAESSEKKDDKEEAIIEKDIISAKLVKPEDDNTKKTSANHVFKHSHNFYKAKKRKGNKAEYEVYNCLTKKYGKENVKWLSLNDDSLGYDISYKSENGQWKYVEVKTFSNNMFYLSSNEKKFAEENKKFYELFLVSDQIFKIKNINFSDDEEFLLNCSEYEVYYKLVLQ